MLVVDQLHEFELGVWKTLFKHLIRLLYAASPQGDLVAELDLRCVQYFYPICMTHSNEDIDIHLHLAVIPSEDLLPMPQK